MKVLVIGATGQMGRALAQPPWPAAIRLDLCDRGRLDLTATDRIAAFVEAARPDLVINAAGYTAVDRAESEPGLSFAVNAVAPGRIAAGCAAIGAGLIHLSTDYVFDGAKGEPYREGDPVAPLGVYGRSKQAGEDAVRAAGARHVILRTAWLFSPHGQNFVKTILRLARERDELEVVDDQLGCPTAAGDLAQTIIAIAARMSDGDDRAQGTFHAAGGGAASWHGLAAAILADLARRGGPRPRLRAIPTAAFPLPARRPPDSRLDCGRLAATFGLRLPDWQDALARVLHTLHEPA